MKPIALLGRLLMSFLLLAFIAGCKEDESPTERNRSVRPADFLSDENYKSLTVELVFVEGMNPTATTVAALKTFLAARLNKPAGINIVERSIASPGAGIYDVDLLRQIELEHRTQNTDDDMLTAFFFFADGDYANNSGTSKSLGIAYDYSSMAIFESTVREFSGGPGKPSNTTLETTVMQHEFSHILGLVNNGTPITSEHHDPAHDGHCTTQDCLMYYLAETSGIAANLFGGTVPKLDANCLADLKANGGK
jgi:hypothetical protein